MRFIKLLLLIVIFMSLFLSGCGNENNAEKETVDKQENNQVTTSNDQNKKEKEEEKVELEPLPSTYTELENKPVGMDSEHIPLLSEEDIEKAIERFRDLPNIKDVSTEKELDYYYQELLSRVQKDFNGPESLINQLKFQSFGNPEVEDTRYQFKENLNVEVILDASGSMAQDANGKTKMEAAKEEISSFVENLPEGTKVGLRVYGHKGSNADADKELSCSSSEILYPIEAFDPSKFKSALGQVKPTGWTPISLALTDAQKDLSEFDGETNTNIVYLVSDGIETCDQNPVDAAKKLFDSNVKPIINVIGFNVDGAGQKQLNNIADATEGIYSNVEDQAGLEKELEKIDEVAEAWNSWKQKGKQAIELKEIQNGLDIFGYITQEESKAVKESDQIYLLLSAFKDNGNMSKESYEYLEKKNREYHQWIKNEIKMFNDELKNINQQNYQEAKKALEEKYQLNSQ
jgi:Ca-activated chloride channel homolog